MSLMRLYEAAPFAVQNAVVSLKGLQNRARRFGSEFQRSLQGYRARDSWSYDRIIEYREARRVEALQRASLTPFYSALFKDRGATWRDFVEPSAFATLPIITRAELAADIDAFRCRPALRSDRIETTSGTTGTSLSFPVSSGVEPDQWAVWWRYRERLGLKLGERCALFASFPVVRSTHDSRPYRLNLANNEIRFSIFHISEETVRDYFTALNRYRPTWVHGNPTAISLLCQLALAGGMSLDHPVRIVTVGSENLLPWQREAIQRVFSVSPRQHYGLAEAVANISEWPDGLLRVDEDFSYTEFVNLDDDSCAIVGTPFSNSALGLLRYHTGDLARLASPEHRGDGWGRVVEHLDGRQTDYVVLPNGRRVASLAGPFHATPNLAAAQIYQTAAGALIIRYVPGKGWSDEQLPLLEERLRARVGSEIAISFERHSHIARTAKGKTKLVVSDYVAA